MTRMFRSLRHRNFRLFITGTTVSHTGTWMQRVAQDWLVVTLADNDGVALGITTALQYLPALLFSPWSGVLADRYPKRSILMVSASAMAVAALALGLLDLTGAVRLWHVYGLAFVLGLGSALEIPARQSFVFEMVGPEDTANAVGLHSTSWNLGRTMGPVLAGWGIVVTGTGEVIVVNALSYGAVLVTLARMRTSDLRPGTPLTRAPGQLREGIRYLRRTRDLSLLMCLVLSTGVWGQNLAICITLMATQEFHTGPQALGLLTTALAVGALFGSLRAASKGLLGLRPVIVGIAAFGVVAAAAGGSPQFLVFAGLLVVAGFMLMMFTTSANSTIQLRADPAFRGRVNALYVTVLQGGTALGAPVVGLLGAQLGARWALVIAGTCTIATAMVGALILVRRRGVSVRQALRLSHQRAG